MNLGLVFGALEHDHTGLTSCQQSQDKQVQSRTANLWNMNSTWKRNGPKIWVWFALKTFLIVPEISDCREGSRNDQLGDCYDVFNCAFGTIPLILGEGYFLRTSEGIIPTRILTHETFFSGSEYSVCKPILCACSATLYGDLTWLIVYAWHLKEIPLENNCVLHWFSLLLHFWGLNIIW